MTASPIDLSSAAEAILAFAPSWSDALEEALITQAATQGILSLKAQRAIWELRDAGLMEVADSDDGLHRVALTSDGRHMRAVIVERRRVEDRTARQQALSTQRAQAFFAAAAAAGESPTSLLLGEE